MNEDLRRHMIQTWNNFYQTIECGDFVAVREKNDGNEEVFSNEDISGNFYRGQILDEIKVKFSNGTLISNRNFKNAKYITGAMELGAQDVHLCTQCLGHE